MKNYILIIILIFSNFVYSDQFPESIDHFSMQPLKAKFIRIHDPGYIVIELFTGDIIDTTYDGIDFETLYSWEKNDKKTGNYREMSLMYNNAEGVILKDNETGKRFFLTGVVNEHPIKFAFDECEDKYSSKIGVKSCQILELDAWDAELNRVYQMYGGTKNIELRNAQRAWIKYKEAQIDFLRSNYLERKGTIWPLVYLKHVINITKNQVKLLKSVKEW